MGVVDKGPGGPIGGTGLSAAKYNFEQEVHPIARESAVRITML
jgi:hypothetical protein